MTVIIDESKWPQQAEFYDALEENGKDMMIYVDALAKIAGIYRAATESP